MNLLTRLIKSEDRAYDAGELLYCNGLPLLRASDAASISRKRFVRGRRYLAVFCAVKRGED